MNNRDNWIISTILNYLDDDCPSDIGLIDRPDCKFFKCHNFCSNDEIIEGDEVYCHECKISAIESHLAMLELKDNEG